VSTIYGPDGRPISSSKNKPITQEIAVASIRDKFSTYPSSGLTPERLATIFKEADAGDVYRQMELFEEMEEKDPHLFSILQTRKNSVLSLEYEIHPYSEDPDDVKAAQLIQEIMEFEGLEDVLLDLLDAVGKGYALSEIMYSVSGDRVMVDKLKWVHQKRTTFDDYLNMRLLTDADPSRGIEIPDNKFVIHRYRAKSGHPNRAGVIRVCAWMYLFKNYDIKDWVAFAEVYGMPLRLGKYDASASKEDKDTLMKAVTMLGTDAAGIISKNTEIEFVEAVRSSTNVYKTLADFCNAEMSKAVLGQTLTTEVGDRGSYAAGKVHNDVREDLKLADCKALAETLRRDLFRPLVRFNLGEKPRLPYLKFKIETPEDTEKTARVYSIVIKDIGLPVSKQHVYEKFGIPKPGPNEDLIVPPPAASPLPLKAGMVPMVLSAARAGNPQEAIDGLADKALRQAGPVLSKMIEPIKELISRVATLEEMKERLAEVYLAMDTAELEDLVARCMFISDLFGRWSVDA
jgi:phage gp29-like protein